jgi:hypothetical protein
VLTLNALYSYVCIVLQLYTHSDSCVVIFSGCVCVCVFARACVCVCVCVANTCSVCYCRSTGQTPRIGSEGSLRILEVPDTVIKTAGGNICTVLFLEGSRRLGEASDVLISVSENLKLHV